MLKWLRDPNTGGGVCPWDARVTAAAAGNFGFLHENDPIVPDQPQQIACLAWMRAQSPPCPPVVYSENNARCSSSGISIESRCISAFSHS